MSYTLAESRWLGVPVLSPFATSHAIGRSYAANVPSASPSFVHDLKPTELDRSRKTHCTLGFVCNLQRR